MRARARCRSWPTSADNPPHGLSANPAHRTRHRSSAESAWHCACSTLSLINRSNGAKSSTCRTRLRAPARCPVCSASVELPLSPWPSRCADLARLLASSSWRRAHDLVSHRRRTESSYMGHCCEARDLMIGVTANSQYCAADSINGSRLTLPAYVRLGQGCLSAPHSLSAPLFGCSLAFRNSRKRFFAHSTHVDALSGLSDRK